MRVIGVADVERAQREGVPLRVDAADLLTPLARERARDLGVLLAQADAGAAAAPHPAVARQSPSLSAGPREVPLATVNALYRRGAPTRGALDPGGSSAASRPRAAVIGAGHVGSITALRLAESDLFAEVVLVDVIDGLAAGIALDLWHSAGLAGFGTRIRGSAELADIAGADYVVMTAGRARKPGMTRTDLTAANAEIVGPVADRVAELAPQAVLIMVTNPLEEMTHLAAIRSGFPTERVLGMAGVLDSARFCSLVALTGICRPEQVTAYALGSHGPEMVIPLSMATVDGKPLRSLLSDAVLRPMVERTRDSGAEVVALLKTGSAYFAPGQSAARMVIAMASGSDEILPCAVEPAGQYGLRDTRVGLPVRLGPRGLREIVVLALEPAELVALQGAADRLRERIGEVAHAGGDLRIAR